jgi:hypothetical protein
MQVKCFARADDLEWNIMRGCRTPGGGHPLQIVFVLRLSIPTLTDRSIRLLQTL